jgi:hypothetical protein
MMAITSSIALALRLHAPRGSERALVGKRAAQIGKVLEAIALTLDAGPAAVVDHAQQHRTQRGANLASRVKAPAASVLRSGANPRALKLSKSAVSQRASIGGRRLLDT